MVNGTVVANRNVPRSTVEVVANFFELYVAPRNSHETTTKFNTNYSTTNNSTNYEQFYEPRALL